MPDEPEPKLTIPDPSATASQGGTALGSLNIGRDVKGSVYIGGQPAEAPHLRPTPLRPPAHFTGREAELERLAQLIISGENIPIVALQGMGGIGKTAFALKLAERVNTSFPGGILWRVLGLQPDVVQILEEWSMHIGHFLRKQSEPIDIATYANLVRSGLARLGRLCVILDDVWDIDTTVSLSNAIPPGCPILITTRDGDIAKELDCHIVQIDALNEDEVVILLTKLLGSQGNNQIAAREIADLTGGLPLAVKLIAGIANSPTDLPTLASKLREKPVLDILRLPGSEKRDNNVEACLALSYYDLGVGMQRRFRSLGAFAPGPFRHAAIAAVWNEKDDDAVEEAIRRLVRRNLLMEDEETKEYRQHTLLRAYALALLERSDESNTTAQRHANYYQRFSEENDVGTLLEAIQQVELSWDWVRRNAPDRIANYLVSYVLKDGLAEAHIRGDHKSEGTLRNNIGYAYHALGHNRDALDHYEQALTIHRELGDRASEGTVLNNIGRAYDEVGNKLDALDIYEQALAIRHEVGDLAGEGATLNNIGFVYYSLGHQQEALEYYQRSLAIRRQAGDRRGESITLNNMAAAYSALGRQQEALEHYLRSLTICREIGYRRGQGTILNNIAAMYSSIGNKEDAFDTYQQSAAILHEVGDYWDETLVLSNLIALLNEMDRAAETIRYLEQSVLLKEAIGHPDLESDRAKLEELRRKAGSG